MLSCHLSWIEVEMGAHSSGLRAAHAGGLSDRPVLFPGFRPGLPLPPLEGGGAPERRRTRGTFLEGAPPAAFRAASAPSGAPPRRFVTRSPYFCDRTGGLHHSVPGSICAALHPIVSSHQRRAPHRGRTVTAPPGTRLRTSPAGAAIPAPPTERLRGAPSVNGDGVHHM